MAAYAPISETAGAAQTDFTITWDYLRDSHLVVTVDAVASSAYTLVSAGTILRFNTPMVGGEAVVISRSTPIDSRLVDFVDGAGLSEDDLDEAFNQLYFALEETNHTTGVLDLTAYVASAATSASTATTQASTATTQAGLAATAKTDAETAQAAAEAAQAAVEALEQIPQTPVRGLNMSPNVTNPTYQLDITAGAACSTNQVSSAYSVMQKTSTTTAGVDFAVAGTVGGRSSRTTSTWYHIFIISKSSDGTTGFWADTSVTCANIPSGDGYDYYRRIGSVYLNATGLGEIEQFWQNGDQFVWDTLSTDYQSWTNSATASSLTLKVPPDVKVKAEMNVYFLGDGNQEVGVFFSTPNVTDRAVSLTGGALPNAGGNNSTGGASVNIGTRIETWTNTSKQVRIRAHAAFGSTRVETRGWLDPRGAS